MNVYVFVLVQACLYVCVWVATHVVFVGTVDLRLKRAGLKYNFYTDFYSATTELWDIQ